MSAPTASDHLGRSARRVLRLIIKTNGAPGGIDKMARKLNRSPRWVKGVLAHLRDTGDILVEDHGCRPNTYKVVTRQQRSTSFSSGQIVGQIVGQICPTKSLEVSLPTPSNAQSARASSERSQRLVHTSNNPLLVPREAGLDSSNNSTHPLDCELARSLEVRSLINGSLDVQSLGCARSANGSASSPEGSHSITDSLDRAATPSAPPITPSLGCARSANGSNGSPHPQSLGAPRSGDLTYLELFEGLSDTYRRREVTEKQRTGWIRSIRKLLADHSPQDVIDITCWLYNEQHGVLPFTPKTAINRRTGERYTPKDKVTRPGQILFHWDELVAYRESHRAQRAVVTPPPPRPAEQPSSPPPRPSSWIPGARFLPQRNGLDRPGRSEDPDCPEEAWVMGEHR